VRHLSLLSIEEERGKETQRSLTLAKALSFFLSSKRERPRGNAGGGQETPIIHLSYVQAKKGRERTSVWVFASFQFLLLLLLWLRQKLERNQGRREKREERRVERRRRRNKKRQSCSFHVNCPQDERKSFRQKLSAQTNKICRKNPSTDYFTKPSVSQSVSQSVQKEEFCSKNPTRLNTRQ